MRRIEPSFLSVFVGEHEAHRALYSPSRVLKDSNEAYTPRSCSYDGHLGVPYSLPKTRFTVGQLFYTLRMEGG